MERNYEKETISLGDIAAIVLRNWKWYLLSLGICLALAFLYVKKSPLIYERHAMVIIKTQKSSNRMQGEAEMLQDIGVASDGYLVENELIIFKSRRLMEEVVRRLGLEVSYSQKEHLREISCYSSTPIKFEFPDTDKSSEFSFVMTPLKDQTISLHDFNVGRQEFETRILSHVGDTVNTPIGRIIVRANLKANPYSKVGEDIIVRKNNLEKVTSVFCDRLNTSQNGTASTIINLSLYDVSPDRAEDILNTLVQVYDEDAIQDKNRVAVNTEKFLDEQLELLESELDDVDMIIARYKATHKLTDITSDASSYRSTVNSIEQRSADLQNQKTVAEFVLDYIQKQEASGDFGFEVIPNYAGLNSGQIENLISDYNTQIILREKLTLDAGPNNPQVQDLTNSIVQMRQRIISSIRNLRESLDIEIQGAEKRAIASTGRLTAVPEQQKTVTSVERRQSTKEQLYMYLLNKRQENSLAKSITESNARVLDPAMGSNVPVEPKVMKIMLIGLFSGLIIPSLVFWLMLMANVKVRSKKDLSKIDFIPLVGEIPQVHGVNNGRRQQSKKRKGKNKTHHNEHRANPIVFNQKSRDSLSESIRILRTNVNFISNTDNSPKAIMTTSFMPGDGKTFICGNFGMSLAVAGHKVVMIDMDIRRASLTHDMGMNSSEAGLSDYLSGIETDIDKVIHHTTYSEALDIIPCGSHAPNPTELLMSKNLDKLVATLKERYDYVLLDAVPVNIVADAMVGNRVADVTLFIIRSGQIDKRILPDIGKLYDEDKLNKMCLVLNGISDSHVYGSGYGYGYRYGYGYGYNKYYGNSED